jgi:hypothetical protein
LCSSLRLAICTVTCPPKISCTPQRKGLPHVAAVGQQALSQPQTRLAATYPSQRSLAIRHLGGGDLNSMGQTLCVHCNVALDARNFLARVIALATGRVRVLHALRVHDQ